jgi:hypothetical protein
MSTSAYYPTSLIYEQWSVLQLMLPDSKSRPYMRFEAFR